MFDYKEIDPTVDPLATFEISSIVPISLVGGLEIDGVTVPSVMDILGEILLLMVLRRRNFVSLSKTPHIRL